MGSEWYAGDVSPPCLENMERGPSGLFPLLLGSGSRLTGLVQEYNRPPLPHQGLVPKLCTMFMVIEALSSRRSLYFRPSHP